MNSSLLKQLDESFVYWMMELDQYPINQFLYKPDQHSWCLGQLYNHLIEQSEFYLQQIEICLGNQENLSGAMNAAGKSMFLHNSFPDLQIKGPASNDATPSPENTDACLQKLKTLRKKYQDTAREVDTLTVSGKTRHPGLGYFNAAEWVQFASMHFQHHLRQKRRIEECLQSIFIQS